MNTTCSLPLLLATLLLLCGVPLYGGTSRAGKVGDEVIAQVNHTLSMAGLNKSELEKVLVHYQNDELKYRAACFLIANMDVHFSYASDGIDAYYHEMDSVFSNTVQADSIYKNAYYHASTKNGNLLASSSIKWDCQELTADLLIKQIDGAFDMWKKPWNKNLSFSLFCEYVLPYRILNEPVAQVQHRTAIPGTGVA